MAFVRPAGAAAVLVALFLLLQSAGIGRAHPLGKSLLCTRPAQARPPALRAAIGAFHKCGDHLAFVADSFVDRILSLEL